MKGVLLSLVGLSAFVAADGGAQDKHQKGKYGKVLVAEYRLPEDKIAKIAAFRSSAAQPGESKGSAVVLATAEEWFGPAIDVKYASNPYTLVVTLTGTARADGDALTLWQSGWRFDSNERRYTSLSGLSKLGAKAGEPFTVTAAAVPTSFKDNRSNIAVALGFVNARNVDIHTVDVALWSGVASATWMETLGAFSYLLIGLGVLVLIWAFRRRGG